MNFLGIIEITLLTLPTRIAIAQMEFSHNHHIRIHMIFEHMQPHPWCTQV